MTTLNPVVTQFTANAGPFFAELNKVRGELGGFTSQIKRVAGGMVAGFSVAALTNFVRSAAEAADQVGKTADKLGLSTEKLTAFQRAADDAGVSIEAANKLLVESQKRLGEAAGGSGEAAKYLKAFNLNVKDLQKLSPDELFLRYSDSIATLRNRSERMAAAQALFGKSAQEAFNLIEAGRPALQRSKEETERYGLALNKIDTAKLTVANDKISLLGAISQAAGQRIAVGLSPFISAASESILGATGNTEALQSRVEQFGAVAYTAFKIVANAAHTLQAAFFGIAAAGARMLQFVTFGDVSDAFAASVEENLAKARGALDQIKSLAEIQQGIADVMQRARDEAAKSIKPPPPDGGNSLGAAGADKDRQERINAMLQQNEETYQRLAELHYNNELAKRQATAATYAEALNQLTGFAAEQNRINQERVEKDAQTEKELQERLYQFRTAGFAAAETLMTAFGGKFRGIAKVMLAYEKANAIASTIISTKQAVMATYARLGYPWGVPAAAAVAALGVAQVAAIASTFPGSGGAGPSVGAGAGGSFGSPPGVSAAADNSRNQEQEGSQPQRAVQLIFAGNMYGMDDFRETVIETVRDAVDGRDVVVISPSSRQAMEIRGS